MEEETQIPTTPETNNISQDPQLPETLFFAKLLVAVLVFGGVYGYYSGLFGYLYNDFVKQDDQNDIAQKLETYNESEHNQSDTTSLQADISPTAQNGEVEQPTMWEDIVTIQPAHGYYSYGSVRVGTSLYYSSNIPELRNITSKEEFDVYKNSNTSLTYLAEIDPETFEVIQLDSNNYILKDKDHVFCESEILTENSNSLRLENVFFVTDTGVYGGYLNICKARTQVDFPSFYHATRSYYYDKSTIYAYVGDAAYGASLVSLDIEPGIFKLLDGGFVSDGKNVIFPHNSYSNNQITVFANSDPDTFEYIQPASEFAIESGITSYYKDKNQVYRVVPHYEGGGANTYAVKNADPATFEVIVTSDIFELARDKNFLYQRGEPIEGSDPATLQTFKFSDSFFMDQNFVYLSRDKLDYIDRATFKFDSEYMDSPIDQVIYASDKNNKYVLTVERSYGTDHTSVEISIVESS